MEEKYFVAKIQYDLPDENTGKIKKIREEKLVNGYSVTDVEAKVTKKYEGFTHEWRITAVSESKIDEVKSINNESDNKKIEGLINQYEDGVKRKTSLINNPPMNPDAAMRDLDAIDAELNGISGKLNEMTLSDEQKTRFNSAKAKNKKLS